MQILNRNKFRIITQEAPGISRGARNSAHATLAIGTHFSHVKVFLYEAAPRQGLRPIVNIPESPMDYIVARGDQTERFDAQTRSMWTLDIAPHVTSVSRRVLEPVLDPITQECTYEFQREDAILGYKRDGEKILDILRSHLPERDFWDGFSDEARDVLLTLLRGVEIDIDVIEPSVTQPVTQGVSISD